MNSKITACVILVSILVPVSLITGDPSVHASPSIVDKVTEIMLEEYIRTLQDFGPRLTGSPACQEAASYISTHFQGLGFTVREHVWSYQNHEDINIEATHQGVNSSSDILYIVCAHHDSVSGSPGADDNGSGTAAVLAAATVLSRYHFEHTIRFVTFSGEEQGLHGSHIYALEAQEKDENIVAVFNADMIAYTETAEGKNNVKVYEDAASTWITDRAIAVTQAYPSEIGLSIGRPGPSSRSDHASFWEYGYNAIFFHEYEFTPHYHSSADTLDTLDIDYATRVTRLIVGTLIDLAGIVEDDYEDPVLSITTPREGYLYVGDTELMPLPHARDIAVILGNIEIQATATDNQSGIHRVEFYMDGVLKHTDSDPPYSFRYTERSFFRHTLGVRAYDNKGNTNYQERTLFTVIP